MPFDPSSGIQSVKSGGFDPSNGVQQLNNPTPRSIDSSATGANDATSGTQFLPNDPNAQGMANEAMSEGHAFLGGAQQAAASMTGQALNSPQITQSMAPSAGTQAAMDESPNAAMAGNIAGAVGGAGALIAGTRGAAAPVVGDGLIADATAMGISNSILGGGSLGAHATNAVIGAAMAPVAQTILKAGTFVVQAAGLSRRFEEAMTSINNMIKGTPAKVASTGQANTWNVAATTEKAMAGELNDNGASTVASNVSSQAQKVLADYNSPLKIGSLSNEQEGVLKKLIALGKPQDTSVPASSILDESGNPMTPAGVSTTPPTQYSFNELYGVRKELDQIISQAYNKVDSGEINRDIANSFGSLRAPMIQDLSNAAEKAGLLDKYQAFNGFYQEKILPLLNTGAKDTFDTLNSTTDPLASAKLTDTLLDKYANPAKPEQGKVFLGTLDPAGQTAFAARMVERAAEKATGRDGTMDYLIYKNEVQKVQSAFGESFPPEFNTILNGLNKTIDEASTFAGMQINTAKIGTGYKITGALGLTAAVAGAGAYEGNKSGQTVLGAIASAGLLLGAAALISSPAGRALLYHAGSDPSRSVVKSLVQGLAIQGALKATSAESTGQ